MVVRVLYFGGLRERCGVDEETCALPQPADVRTLKEQLAVRHTFLRDQWKFVRVAVNLDFSDDDTAIHDGDEVALIPPVAGGSDEARVILTDAPLGIARACESVMAPGFGGLCMFAGAVRDHARGRAVVAIDYSAY